MSTYARLTLAGILLLLAVPAFAAGSAVRLESAISADAAMVVLIDDAPTFLERWPTSALGRAWDDPQIKRFLAPMREEMGIDRWEETTREETGFGLGEILEELQGQIAFVVPDVDSFATREDGEDKLARYAVIAAVGENDEMIVDLMRRDLETTNDDAESKFEEIEEEFRGEVLHLRKLVASNGADAEGGERVGEGEGWTIADGRLVVAEPHDYLREIVDALKDSTSSTFAAGSGYRKLTKHVGSPDLLIFVNVAAFMPMIEEGFLDGAGADDAENPMGLDGETMLRGMKLDAIESLFLSALFEENATRVDMGLQFTEAAGLLKLLAFRPGPVRPPKFIPENVISAGVSKFSLSGMWEGMKELIVTVNPMLGGMMEMQLQQLSSASGLDVESGVFGSLGDTVVSAELPRAVERPGEEPLIPAVDKLIGIEVTDRQSLEMSLEAMWRLVAPGAELFETSDYLGHAIHQFKQPMENEGQMDRVAYALTEDYLLVSVGTDAPLRAALARRDKPGKTVFDRSEVRAAIKRLPSGASGISYVNTEWLVQMAVDACVGAQAFVDEGEEAEGTASMCDADAVPDPGTLRKYFGPALGGVYSTAGGLYNTIRLENPRR